ncbi:MAG: aldehyde dehydrogenase family protein, partial [Actinoplanes sp.]
MTATRVPGVPVIEDGVLISTNPATGAEAGRVPVADADAVVAAVARAKEAAAWWQSLGYEGRKVRMLRWRALLVERITELAQVTSLETGKPETDAIVETSAAVEHLDWAARNAKRVLGPRRTRTRLLVAEHSGHVEYQPYGVVGVIGPW